MSRSSPSSCSPSVVCGAITYMDRLSYGGFFEEAEKRAKVGDKQVYCKNCGLCRWPEEQRTCDNFVRSDELERFYASEANDKSLATAGAPMSTENTQDSAATEGCAPVAGSESCPGCTRELTSGKMVYECRVCGEDCCTACSDTTAKHDVVCDGCLDGGYDDGWTQGKGFSSQNDLAVPTSGADTGENSDQPKP